MKEINKSQQLKDFLLQNLKGLDVDSGGDQRMEDPDFELYAFDYLIFAEKNLSRYSSEDSDVTKTNELISCVANLKRALDVQIECFLQGFGIREKLKRRNLSLDQKLEFIHRIGIFSSRSIRRFCTIRNQIEHEFRKPEVLDIESMYDLVSACVSLLQMYSLAQTWRMSNFVVYRDEEKIGYLQVSYNCDDPEIEFNYKSDETVENPESFTLCAKLNEREEFEYFFRCMLLLSTIESYASWDSLIYKIKAEQAD